MDVEHSQDSIAEILKHGIKAEMLSHRFYLKGQMYTKDRELVVLFGSLAQDELRHESQLRSLYKTVVGDDAPDQLIDTAAEIPVPIGSDPLEVLRMAMEREQRARSYYRFLAAQVNGDEAKNLLLLLESQEEHHYELLEMELNARRNLPWSQPELDNWVRDD